MSRRFACICSAIREPARQNITPTKTKTIPIMRLFVEFYFFFEKVSFYYRDDIDRVRGRTFLFGATFSKGGTKKNENFICLVCNV
jgi:hypothetical protein